MPLFHWSDNTIEPVDQTSFAALRILERADLQRILRSKLDVIAPNCMLIAEEFGDWDDARRRIDLLALDKDANLVVIELKRTEEGGHLDLQALRYAAMISTMTFEQAVEAHDAHLRRHGDARDARQAMLEFLEWDDATSGEFARDVRLVLVSADFSKEVTTTVLWLNEHDVDIRCVRLRPYSFKGETLIDVQPLIPLPEAAEYQIRVRQRNEERRVTASIASERDHTKFDVTIAGVREHAVNKRKAVLKVVRGLAAAGITPEQMMSVVPERGDRFFVSVPGTNAADFSAAARAEMRRSGRTFDEIRWFCREDEVIRSGDRMWAVSNQWGANTEDVLRRLVGSFPAADVHVEAAR